MTKRDFILMAKWISEHTSSDEEWSHIRDSHIRFACFVAGESDKTRGNQKLFDKEKFLRYLDALDEAKKTRSLK
ncbi:hypothetical protein LCGC14_2603410 [marine sediment metagenome]|uniref:Uncharacterized protein n=1 Tax=marine sediment metagenome TaxID=412755 RepID=A0A0F9AVT6_9ZZZZ